ncbi:MAG: alpha/beta fold hydrolase [Piscinibacter sp.]|nr:alpha/beta fold hydrolase [Piscinibacter sp.]
MPEPTLPAAATPQPLDLPLKAAVGRLTHGISPIAVGSALFDWWSHLAVSPGKQLELGESALRKTMRWWLWLNSAALGEDDPCIEPAPQDHRFTRPAWRHAPHQAMAQGFLLWEQWWQEATRGVRGVSAHHEEVAAFVARQVLDTLSPSNSVALNPEVLEETLRRGGANLVEGAANWWRDAMAVLSDGKPKDAEKFVPGRTVALTPGKVVFRNRLIELIQYAPATPKVHPEPVLIVPSWIMKYYILDLSPHNSMVRHLVEQGHTVFMISWRNPGPEERELAMEDYVELGVLAALDAVQRALPRRGIHAVGYCLGGTLLAIAAAALARDDGSALKSLSLLAAQIDFQEPGELGLFIDESQIAFLEDIMAERGCLDGRQMAGAFALINSKDLVWSKLVHEYLMGAQTPLTDLRAWNADATRMPARMHGEYLRGLYLHNDLAEGRYRVRGRPVAVQDIRLPVFCVATERDHVSPWRSVYKIHLLTDTDMDFVLTGGGHNVGIVNPPTGPGAFAGAHYRHAHRAADAPYVDPQQWFDAAAVHPGSWWVPWQRWLAQRSGRPVTPPALGGGVLTPLDDAPGRYVLQS